jgi:hypothetical protein
MPFTNKAHQVAFNRSLGSVITSPLDGSEMSAGSEVCLVWTNPYGQCVDLPVTLYINGTPSAGVIGGQCFDVSEGSYTVYVVGSNGVASNSVSFTAIAVATEVSLNSPGDGTYHGVGETIIPTWTVDQGSDYGTVYVAGGPYGSGISVGSGNSGSVEFPMTSGGNIVWVTVGSVESSHVYIYECTYGCTDSGANNYNPSATCDDGSCNYCIYGCTDLDADNYNGSATCDDGSCLYPPSGFFAQPYSGLSFTDADTIDIDLTWTNGGYSDASAVLKVSGAAGNLVDPVPSGGWTTGIGGATISGGVESTYTLELVITYNGGSQTVSIFSNSFVIQP